MNRKRRSNNSSSSILKKNVYNTNFSDFYTNSFTNSNSTSNKKLNYSTTPTNNNYLFDINNQTSLEQEQRLEYHQDIDEDCQDIDAFKVFIYICLYLIYFYLISILIIIDE